MSANSVINWDELKKRYWDISEIVTTNPPVAGQKVAKVGDMVVDWSVGIFRVSAVATDGTNVATLEPKLRFTDSSILDPNNGSLISALSLYMPNAATRAMFDKDVYPYTITTDPRYVTRGIEATSMRAFFGTDITDQGEIISGNFDGSGALVSDTIVLVEHIAGEPRVKRPPVFETKRVLVSEDVITYVYYDASGRKVGTQPFLVTDSSAIFDYAASTNYITGVELRGDLIDASDNKLINNQLNSPFQTALLEAWLSYHDGTEVKVPIDGTKCSLHGVSNFNTSILGNPKNVVLSYYPSPLEPAINMGSGVKKHISVGYKLANHVVDTSFILKAYVVPHWDSANNKYEYKYYLTNLAGDVDADVTAYVNVKDETGVLLPGTNHGNQMTATLGLDLDVVMPGAYPGHYHAQQFLITTEIPGSVGFLPWSIDYVGDGSTVLGDGAVIHVSNADTGYLNLGKEFTSLSLMLGTIYTRTAPLYDPAVSLGPNMPTHAVIMYGGAELEIELATQWDKDQTLLPAWPNWVQGSTATVKWLVKDGANTQVKAITPLLVLTDL